MWENKLTKETYLLYAASYYSNTQTWGSFFNDMKFFGTVNRNFINLREPEYDVKVNNLMNNIKYLGNIFIEDSLARLLFFLIEEEFYPILKTILYYIQRLPKNIPEAKIDEIEIDKDILEILK